MIAEDLQDFKKFTAKTLPREEPFVFGHRACQGCGEVLALRQVAKAIGRPMIAVSATGCMEIISSPYPQTAWDVPWIHVAFENAAAVAAGVEAGASDPDGQRPDSRKGNQRCGLCRGRRDRRYRAPGPCPAPWNGAIISCMSVWTTKPI